jgi:hypothetical protein
MVGAGRPSTFCLLFQSLGKEKTRGWPAFADHDDERDEWLKALA